MDTTLESPKRSTTPALPDPEEEISAPAQAGAVGPRASWPFSLDTIQQAMSPYNARAKQALIAAFRWCNDLAHPVDRRDFAPRVGINENTLYKIYMGKYRYPEDHAKAGQIIHPKEEFVARIEKWLALEKKRFSMGETEIVQTPTLKSAVTLCNLVRESQTIGFVVGPSHIGKTWALRDFYTPNNNHGRTIYVRLEAASGLGGMVRAIAGAMGISPKGNTQELIHRIKNGLTKDMLLILDECHLLAHTYRKGSFFNCMEVIRELHDVKGVGIVLSFTVLDDVTAAKQKELQQIWRRAIHKLNLPAMPTIEDLTAILEHNGLKFPDKDLEIKIGGITEKPRELLRQLARSEALKAITERIRYARNLAKKADKPVSWAYFIEAHLRIAKQADPAKDWV